jgi:signal transduction histidine kinase
VTPAQAPLRTDGSDAPLLRRARWRLAAWSGGATLATLALLGVVLYVSLNAALGRASEEQLERQADRVAEVVHHSGAEGLEQMLGGSPDEDDEFGAPQFGGEAAGTITILVSPTNEIIGRLPEELAGELPLLAAVQAARGDETDVRNATIADTPIRVMSASVEVEDQTWVVQILQDRTEEQRVLATALLVLLLAGLVALLASVAFGWLYAGSALVPIRESLRRQREFAADASHELRTPIAIIRAGVDEVRRNHPDAARRIGRTIDDMEAEADRLTRLVDDLLILARADSGRLEMRDEAVDLADAAGDALQRLSARASLSGVHLRLEAAPSEVSGDPDRLRQLFGILVDNALRHSPSGTTVDVEVRPDDRHAVATVQDYGRGIAAQDLPRVFDRFWRAADAPPDGTGLGLAIARSIVEQHGGSISAENTSGVGARFSIRLPLRRHASHQAE